MNVPGLNRRTGLRARIQPGEGPRTAIMLVYSAAAVGGVLTVGKTVGQTLFLSQLPASAVPFTFILPSLSIVLTLLLYNWLTTRMWFPHVAAALSATLLLSGLVFRLLLAGGHSRSFAILAGTFLWCETSASVMTMQFWIFAAQIFNPRQARRLFGLIATGGTLSSIVAGLSLAALVHVTGVNNLLLVVVASLGVCGACAVLLRRWVPRAPAAHGAANRGGHAAGSRTLLSDLGALWRSPIVRAIAGLTILVSLLINIAAYQFFLALQVSFSGHGEAMAGFLGGFAFWAGIAALAMQLVVTTSVMTRLGLFVAQLFFPLAMALSGAAVVVTWGALGAVVLARACDPVFRRTIHEVSLNALYVPVPAEVRQRARALLEGLYALTFGVAGAVFLFLQHAVPAWTYQYWSVPILLLAAAWLPVLMRARQAYVSSVAQSVNARRLDVNPLIIDVADETTVALLVQVLRSADDRQVIHVLHVITDARSTRWVPHVVALLAHPSPEVRIMALRYLATVGDRTHTGDIAGLLEAREDDVRNEAIAVLCSLQGAEAVDRVASFLDNPGVRTSGAAVAAVLRYGEQVEALHAAERLNALICGGPEMRREAARVLGTLAAHDLDPSVVACLTDPSAGVPPVASDANEATRRPLIAALIRLLDDKEIRGEAADALVRYDTEALPAIRAVLDDGTQTRAMRMEACRILSRIGGRGAARILLDHVSDPDETVRLALYRAIAHLRRLSADVLLDDIALQSQLLAEIWNCYQLRVCLEDMRADGDDDLLADALRSRVDRAFDRIFSLLAIRHPEHVVVGLPRALKGDANARAMAAELLDSLVDRRIAHLLLPLLEGSVERVVECAEKHMGIQRRSARERLGELARSMDPWLRACAIFRTGLLGDPSLAPLAIDALRSDDPVVCETALAVCGQLLAPSHLAAILSEQSTLAAFPAVRRYARALPDNARIS